MILYGYKLFGFRIFSTEDIFISRASDARRIEQCWFYWKCSLIAAAASSVNTVGGGAFLGVVHLPVFTKFECHFLIDLSDGDFFFNLLENFLIVVFIDRLASNCKVQKACSSPVKSMSHLQKYSSCIISWFLMTKSAY